MSGTHLQLGGLDTWLKQTNCVDCSQNKNDCMWFPKKYTQTCLPIHFNWVYFARHFTQNTPSNLRIHQTKILAQFILIRRWLDFWTHLRLAHNFCSSHLHRQSQSRVKLMHASLWQIYNMAAKKSRNLSLVIKINAADWLIYTNNYVTTNELFRNHSLLLRGRSWN